MDDEKNKNLTQQENDGQVIKHKKSLIPVLLTIAVVISLSVLGYYAWKTGQVKPSEKPPEGNTTPIPTTTEPTKAPTATPTPIPTPTSTPTPSPTPMPTPIPKLGFRPVKALYLKPGTVQDNAMVEHYIELANRTEISAYVIDIKGDGGTVLYQSGIEDVIAAGANLKNFDIRKVIQKFHDNHIRVIGRIVTFKDSMITKYKPELAIKHNGGIFKQPETNGYSHWLDATNPDAWEYIALIVDEAVRYGFDEIQFDYIRFPETSLYDYELEHLEEGKERREYIEDFIAYVRNRVPEDTVLSADIFGMPMISSRDYGEIGQTLETIGLNLDYISPMIYPSHYANDAQRGAMSNKVGQVINGIKFTHPDLKPYEIVYNTLMAGKKRIEAVDGYELKCRPYLQGFTASYLPEGYWMEYKVEAYRAQIQAVYDAGYEEWIFWNAPNEYVEEAFLPEDQE